MKDSTYLRTLSRITGAQATLLQKRRLAKTLDFQGITVRIDRPAGFVQRGRDEKGQEWERTYKTDYGYIPGTSGGDDEPLDVYMGPDRLAPLAYWVQQRKGSGEFDEYKLMLGFPDRRSARAMWSSHTPERFYGGIATTSLGVVKALLGLEPVRVAKALDGMVEDSEQEPARSGGQPNASEGIRRAIDKTKAARVLKAEDRAELHYVLGVVLEPDVVDAQGETYDAATIRDAAWLYMMEFQNAGLQHKQLVNREVRLVESYCAPVDMTIGGIAIKIGTWLIGYFVQDDELWEAVKRGDLGGLSIGGVATKLDPDTGRVLPPPPEQARFQGSDAPT